MINDYFISRYIKRGVTLFVFIVMLSITSFSQVLSGHVIGPKGKPVPWATVFVKELMFGTTANQEGFFELKLPDGKYTCVFQSMGYQTKNIIVSVHEDTKPLTVEMEEMVYELSGVVISGNGEDPAYGIMRRVIQNAPLYAGMIRSYKADVYIRGSLEIKSIAKVVKWMAKDELKESGIKEGDVYLEESVNEVEFTAMPFKVNQRVKSIHSTFPTGNESRASSAIGFVSGNLYRPDAFGNAWSPLAPGAFNHYRFSLMGTQLNGNVTVNKIKIIPKGSGPKYMKGTIFIVDGLWCIYSIDVDVDEQLGVNIKLSQNYGEIKTDIWVPVSNRVKVNMDLLGNAGGFSYNTSIRYHKIKIKSSDIPEISEGSSALKKQTQTNQKRIARLNEKAESLMGEDDPSTLEAYRLANLRRKTEVLKLQDSLRDNHEFVERYKTTVDSNARIADTAFWSRVRPIPLTQTEQISLQHADSMQMRQSLRKADSSSKKPYNKRLFSTLLTGGRYDADSANWFTSAGLLNIMGLSYNTVYSLVYRSRFSYNHRFVGDDKFRFDFKPGVSFGRQAFVWNVAMAVEGSGQLKNVFKVEGGSDGFDFNREGGATNLENSVSSLIFRENLQNLYRKDYVSLTNSMQPFLGAELKTGLYASEASPLQNIADFSLFYKDKKDFKANIPDNENYTMVRHRDLLLDVLFSWQPTPFYYVRDGKKIARNGLNNAPVFFAQYKKSIPVDEFFTDFDLVKVGLLQSLYVGLEDKLEYEVEAGKFLSNKRAYFDDFVHFNVQPRVMGGKDIAHVFNLIQYYNYSTTDPYFAANVSYRSHYLFLNRLPLIRNRLWEEHLTMAWLATQNKGYHIEAGYGLGNLFYDFAVYAGLNNSGKVNWGFRLTFPFISRKEISIGM